MIMMALAAGCSDELDMPDVIDGIPGELENYYFIIGDNSDSRSVDYTDDNHSEFTGGEQLGCFALDASGNAVAGAKSNACYTVSVIKSNNEAVNGKRVLVPQSSGDKLDKGYAKYLFYYPYNKDIKSLDDLKNYTHTVRENQSEKEDYEASDLLWDVAVPTERYCKVEMDHAMANIIIVIDGVEYDIDKGAVVLDQSLTATGINLTAPAIEDMWKTDGSYYYKVDESQPRADIMAMYSLYSEANDRFRAAVPANRTLKAGTKIIKLWSKATGLEKTFTLKNDILLEAGKNYYFTLIKKGRPNPSDNDDDSWVLDVLDPETGAPVGLLCREYLHFQREYSFNYNDKPTSPADENGIPVLNSQAWVFYNLQADGKTPELSEGHVLRFVYDVRTNMTHPNCDDYPGLNDDRVKWWGYAWPAPHIYWHDGDGQGGTGLFLARHGYGWSRVGNYGVPNNPDAFLGEYYMHGGKVIWNGADNEILQFIMPAREKSATTDEAERYGHIAIPRNPAEGVPYVSYDKDFETPEYAENCKVGFIMPHCLIDTRIVNDGSVERRRYPLVKIGFNQFWMSKSLRAKTYTDGTPLHKFNSGRYAYTIHENTPPIAPEGYIYPFYDTNNAATSIDPLYDLGEDYVDQNTDIPLLYNYTCFMNDKLLPISVESISEYVKPSVDDYFSFCHYIGRWGVGKMATDLSAKIVNGNIVSDDIIGDYLAGKLLVKSQIHMGNISGLHLRPWGVRVTNGQQLQDAGTLAAFFIKTDDSKKGMFAPAYYLHSAWNDDPQGSKVFWNEQMYSYPVPPYSQWGTMWDNDLQQNVPYNENYGKWAQTFYQVRFLLKYKNQKEGKGSRSMSPQRYDISLSRSRDVYVAMEPLP